MCVADSGSAQSGTTGVADCATILAKPIHTKTNVSATIRIHFRTGKHVEVFMHNKLADRRQTSPTEFLSTWRALRASA